MKSLVLGNTNFDKKIARLLSSCASIALAA